MRLPLIGGLAGFLVAGAAAADGWLPDGPYLPGALEAVLAILACGLVFAAFLRTLYVLNGHQLGIVSYERFRAVLRAVPWWLLVAAVALLVLCAINFKSAMDTMQAASQSADPNAGRAVFFRAFAGNISWIGFAAAVLAYGISRRAASGRPPVAEEASGTAIQR